jgi:hypothetical protein
MKQKMSDEQFEKRSNALVAEYAVILKEGFPERKLARWNEKVDKLAPSAQAAIRDSIEISDTLKDALMGRERPGHPDWRDADRQSGLSR